MWIEPEVKVRASAPGPSTITGTGIGHGGLSMQGPPRTAREKGAASGRRVLGDIAAKVQLRRKMAQTRLPLAH